MFQGDAFYYLTIARNSAGKRGYTFDGQFPTNGFHPLWQYLLSFLQWLGLFQLSKPLVALPRVFIVDVLLLSLGVCSFVIFASRQLRTPYLALFAAAPGLLWFLVCPVTPGYLLTWSYANGLESALSLAMMATALCLWRDDGRSAARDTAFSVMLGLAVLARLDDAFFLIALALVACWWGISITRWFTIIGPACLLVAAYLVYNRESVGTFLPLSGAAKAGMGLRVNVGWTLKLLIPMFTRRPPRLLASGDDGNAFSQEVFRAFQMVVPAAICAFHLLTPRLRHNTSKLTQALAGGVILKSAYNFVFVAGGYQGPWYYTVSVSVANLILVLWLDRFLGQASHVAMRQRAWCWGYALVVLYSFSTYYGLISQAWGPLRLRALQDGPDIGASLRRQGYSCLTELDDGFVGFALSLPTESGFGLALDLPAIKALKRGTFLPLLGERKCLLTATFAYSVANKAYVDGRQWTTGKPFWAIQASEFTRYALVPQDSLARDGFSFLLLQPLLNPGEQTNNRP